MNERGDFQPQISALLNRHGWSKKFPDLPFPHGEDSDEKRPSAGVFDNIYTRSLRLEGEWWEVAAAVECKTDRGELRFPLEEISENQRRWAMWRQENSRGFSGWLALAMGTRRNAKEHPIVAFMIEWDFWLAMESTIGDRKSLPYAMAMEILPAYQLTPIKISDKWGWEFPPSHPFVVKFRIVPFERKESYPYGQQLDSA